jgi:hypothetical protein
LLFSYLPEFPPLADIHVGFIGVRFLGDLTTNCVWLCSVLVESENVLEEKVGGEYTTFRVYVYLFKAGKASVRDVYRGCGLSSPSLAQHHLGKLEGLDLVRKDEKGVYHVVPRKFGILRFFQKTGKWLIPRSFFYMLLYAAIGMTSAFLLPTGMRELGIVLSIVGLVTSLVDTVLFLRLIR